MITTVNCGLLLQLTRQLVNLSTRQLQIMSTTVSSLWFIATINLSTRQPVNSSTTNIALRITQMTRITLQ